MRTMLKGYMPVKTQSMRKTIPQQNKLERHKSHEVVALGISSFSSKAVRHTDAGQKCNDVLKVHKGDLIKFIRFHPCKWSNRMSVLCNKTTKYGVMFQQKEVSVCSVWACMWAIDLYKMLFQSKSIDIIATDKRGYPHNIFLVSSWKHMLWVFIRSGSASRF